MLSVVLTGVKAHEARLTRFSNWYGLAIIDNASNWSGATAPIASAALPSVPAASVPVPGMGAPISIKDVADAAGVSVGTVSNVLNRPHLVAATTRSRVQEVIGSLGFVRNESARQLRAGRSRTIGLVVLDVTNPFFTDVARGVEDVASEAGLAVVLCNSDDRRTKEDRYLQLLAELRVQGILIVPVDSSDPRLSQMRARGIPVVLLDTRAVDDTQCSVSVDDVAGGRLAVEHLLEKGHERIAFIAGMSALPQVLDRRRGAELAYANAGLDPGSLEAIEVGSLTVAGGRQAGALIVAGPALKRPSAVFCSNDLIALGLLQVLNRHSVSVPGDIAVVGYDDIDFAATASTPLSSVRQPRQQLGRSAAELLLEESSAQSSHVHRHVVFVPELIVRESSAE